jgi:sigma-54 dependent transcriptional regulator, flagellar regulatory protein
MASSAVLLIDDNQLRTQQFVMIVNFLGLEIIVSKTEDWLKTYETAGNISAVFMGGGDRQGALVNSVQEQLNHLPLFLLVEQSCLSQVSSSIQKLLTKVVVWPSTYPVFSELLASIPEPSVQSGRTKKGRRADKGLAGCSEAIRKTRDMIDQVAASDATVLILGESGTGKEVIARALHNHSVRKDKPFVPVNCGAIPGELLESELFGHEKGAFTGALTARQGRFEMAEGGTLFLDEIGDMPMPMQVKLLRVLQERTFERVGSNNTIHCDVRVVAATHRHLEQEIEEKRFREDLFYRLNVFPIEVPSLRERAEDIPNLVLDLVSRMEKAGRGSVRISNGALAILMQHNWPGNVRELANLIERLAIIYPGASIEPQDLPEKFQSYKVPEQLDIQGLQAESFELDVQQSDVDRSGGSSPLSGVTAVTHLPEQGMDLKEYLSDLESDLIRQALDECNGVVAHAAKLLNMRRTTLVEKLRKYELS